MGLALRARLRLLRKRPALPVGVGELCAKSGLIEDTRAGPRWFSEQAWSVWEVYRDD